MRLGEMLLSFLHLSLWPHNPKCAQSSNFMHLGITWNKINAHLLLLWLNCKRSSEPGHAGPWMPSKAFFSYRRSCYLVGWRLAQAHSKQQKVLGQPFLTGRGTEEGRMVQRQRSVIGVRANKNISWAFLSLSSPEPLICQFPSGRKSQGLSASCWASLGHQASLLLLQAATHPEGGKALSAICQSQQSYFFSTHYLQQEEWRQGKNLLKNYLPSKADLSPLESTLSWVHVRVGQAGGTGTHQQQSGDRKLPLEALAAGSLNYGRAQQGQAGSFCFCSPSLYVPLLSKHSNLLT